MRYLRNPLCIASLCAIATAARPSLTEQANLAATIGPGALEIEPASLATEFLPMEANITLTGSAQTDAITFDISGIEINDLNGDGLGWKLTASPQALYHELDGSTLPVGTVSGFANPSDAIHSTIASPNQLIYTSGSGIAQYSVDYRLSYTIPITASAGDYNGVVVFNIVAQ